MEHDRKREVLGLLKVRGGATLVEVAEHLAITRQGALRHLEALESAGLVETTAAPEARPGRPRHRYTLTPAADATFPAAHRELAQDLVRFLERDALDRFFEARTARIEAGYRSRMHGGDVRARAEELARLATENGHMAEVVETPGGGIAIRQCHCPIGDVAMESRTPCRHEQEMYGRLLGAEVVRSASIPDSDPACMYEVRSTTATEGR